jgi:hypothetical protein
MIWCLIIIDHDKLIEVTTLFQLQIANNIYVMKQLKPLSEVYCSLVKSTLVGFLACIWADSAHVKTIDDSSAKKSGPSLVSSPKRVEKV